MVIVHKNSRVQCPTGGLEAPKTTIDIITEYLPQNRQFKITLPEHMHERLNGLTYVTGCTADDCYGNMVKAWNNYQETFIEPREIRKYIVFENDIMCGSGQGILSKEIRIRFYWNIVYLCQLNTDKSDEPDWIKCTEEGKISNSRNILRRVTPGKQNYHEENYVEWTPEIEAFFTQLVTDLNTFKRKMIDFFEPSERENMMNYINAAGHPMLISAESKEEI